MDFKKVGPIIEILNITNNVAIKSYIHDLEELIKEIETKIL